MTTAQAELIEVPSVRKDSANQLLAEANVLSKEIDALNIKDQASYEIGSVLSKTVKDRIKLAESMQKSITDPINMALKAVKSLFAPVLSTLESDKEIIGEKLVEYDNEQQRIQREAEEKLRREAAAEEARLRKIKEDQERAWREKEEIARKEAEALALAGRQEEALKAIKEADKALAKAQERAQEAAEVSVVAPILAPTAPRPTGQSFQERWSGECVDLMALVKAVAAGKASPMLIMANGPAINKQATATKNSLPIDGIRWACTKIPVNR